MKQILCARHWTSIEKNHIVRLLRELQTQKDELVLWNKRCYRTRRLLAEGKTLLCSKITSTAQLSSVCMV